MNKQLPILKVGVVSLNDLPGELRSLLGSDAMYRIVAVKDNPDSPYTYFHMEVIFSSVLGWDFRADVN